MINSWLCLLSCPCLHFYQHIIFNRCKRLLFVFCKHPGKYDSVWWYLGVCCIKSRLVGLYTIQIWRSCCYNRGFGICNIIWSQKCNSFKIDWVMKYTFPTSRFQICFMTGSVQRWTRFISLGQEVKSAHQPIIQASHQWGGEFNPSFRWTFPYY